jgi:succinyl-diaminopimelate desuccinylase
MTDKEKVFAAIDGLKDEAIDLLQNLIALNSVGPQNDGPGEKAKADFLVRYLKKIGFKDVQNYPAPYSGSEISERPNLIARLPGRGKTLWILSHLDVVPEGDLSQWQTNPFEAVVKEGKIFGRGSEDNLQGMVASVIAARALIESDVIPEAPLSLALVSDEETGSKYGLIHLLEAYPELFGKQDLYIVPDSGSPDASMIEIAEKSILWVEFKTIGKQVHGSTPQLGKNAFKAAAYLITKLDGLYQRFKAQDLLFDPPTSTFEPTKKLANVPNINTIPGEDIFYFDCRVLPKYDLQEIVQEIEQLTREVAATFQVTINMKFMQKEQAAPATAKEAPVVKLLDKAIRDVYGVEPQLQGIGGGTVAAHFRKRGFPTAVWATLDDRAHQPNEYCILENLIKDAKVFALVALSQQAGIA